MGSLLPGWDTEYHQESLGIKEELKLAARKSTDSRPLSPVNKEFLVLKPVEKRPSFEALQKAPDLTRKSAPGSFQVSILGQKNSKIVFEPVRPMTPDKTSKNFYFDNRVQEEDIDDDEMNEDENEKQAPYVKKDKWWRKFSSSHLNLLTTEVESDVKHTSYIPQFDLVGSDPYIKHKHTLA